MDTRESEGKGSPESPLKPSFRELAERSCTDRSFITNAVREAPVLVSIAATDREPSGQIILEVVGGKSGPEVKLVASNYAPLPEPSAGRTLSLPMLMFYDDQFARRHLGGLNFLEQKFHKVVKEALAQGWSAKRSSFERKRTSQPPRSGERKWS
jgi:hypothetical protein